MNRNQKLKEENKKHPVFILNLGEQLRLKIGKKENLYLVTGISNFNAELTPYEISGKYISIQKPKTLQ